MRIAIPFGRKALIAGAAIAAGLMFWRARARRAEEDRRFEEEITRAVEEGAAAGGQSAP